MTATLRLLRLLVKHVQHLHPALQEEFEKTDPRAWQCLVPQLFARLNHSSLVVRETLYRLLQRMAVASPSIVCFPAVIGSESESEAETVAPVSALSSSLQKADFSGREAEKAALPDGELFFVAVYLGRNTWTPLVASLMRQSCLRLVRVLEKDNAELIEHIQLFVRELQRITLLREEKWLSVLTHLQHEMNRFVVGTDALEMDGTQLLSVSSSDD